MPIEKLAKVTFYGSIERRDAIVEAVQQLGRLHLIDLRGQSEGPLLEHEYRSDVHQALTYLYASPVQNANQHTRYGEGQHCHAIAVQALENKGERETLSDERDHLVQQIALSEPWGNFRVPDAERIGGMQLWFYQVPRRLLEDFRALDLTWQLVNEDRQFLYVVVIDRQEPNQNLVKPVVLDPRPLNELKQRLEEVDEALESLHWQRVALTRWTTLLQRDLNEADDELARGEATARLLQDGRVFALQAWAPRSLLPELRQFAVAHTLAMTEQKPAWTETPPTLLRNATAIAGAEGAVTFYMTPAYKAWDPTWIMFVSFVFFFAMIMSDAAYGLLMGLALGLFWRRLSGTRPLRAARNLMAAMVFATVVYGVMIGSFFGATPSWLEPFQLKLDGEPLFENRDAMMILALSIGVFHLALANLIMTWRFWGRIQALATLGWASALVGALSYGLTSGGSNRLVPWLAERFGVSAAAVAAVFETGGFGMLVGGLAAVFLFSSSRPLLSWRPLDWLLRIVDGLLALLNASKAFGDTLSYLRLFALGLASAQLAVTFNDLARGAYDVPGVGVLFAILIFVAGHAINLLLGIMGGVVHGLRLNCIEFFNWSLTEEGYPFRAFCKKAG